MARKSTSRRGAEADAGSVIDRMGFSGAIPSTPSEARPGSAVSLEMVNVFGEPVAEGARSAQGAAQAARLRLTAWVNNVSYVKDVWVDAYLMDPSGAVAHSETLVLEYREGAGGGGDFFVLDAPIPSRSMGGPGKPAVAGLRYRLYYQIGETVYTEGILHEHSLGAPEPAPQPAPAAAAKLTSGRTPPAKAPSKAPVKPPTKVVAADSKASAKPQATVAAAPTPPAGTAGKRTPPRRPSA